MPWVYIYCMIDIVNYADIEFDAKIQYNTNTILKEFQMNQWARLFYMARESLVI